MGSFSTNTAAEDNPFTFTLPADPVEEGKERDEYPNPLRAIYDDLAPLLFESEPSTRYPKEFSAVKGFDILIDPLSALMPASAVPDPVIGLTTQRAYRPSIQGVDGLSTHMDILVDASGSMGGTVYGYGRTGFPLEGVDIATIACAMMVAQCQIAKDSFAIYQFGNNSRPSAEWEGPSMEHQACIDWLMGDFTDERPFAPSNGTPLNQGLNTCAVAREGYDFDQAVTCVIMDATFSYSTWKSQIFDSSLKNDNDLRAPGTTNPVFYIIIGSGADASTKATLEESANDLKRVLREHYKQDMDKFVLDFAITMDENGNFKDFAGSLIEISSMNMKKKDEYAEEQAAEGNEVVS